MTNQEQVAPEHVWISSNREHVHLQQQSNCLCGASEYIPFDVAARQLKEAVAAERTRTIMRHAMLESDLKSLEAQFNNLLLSVYDLSIANAPISPQDARLTVDVIGKHVGECRKIAMRMQSIIAARQQEGD